MIVLVGLIFLAIGGVYFLKGIFLLILPFFIKKELTDYEIFCKNIDKMF